ncbi:hypothetical protein M3Y94_00785700 [Aphelenchoides besseyi]|nr:hypothetical protein M3Y94_00785700 [Aphelenchoides besseyi]KAI6232394.1 hypothetical protein M3Y95_00481400 [Aphelenchoides besseyi]
MSRKIVQTFVNRNPRNLEFLRLKRRPTGYEFEADRNHRNNFYMAVLNTTKNSTEGLVVHHVDGVVIEASAHEPGILSQLHGPADANAALNVGRVLAKRCVDAGITNCIPGASTDAIERSKRKTAFFNALRDNGVKLEEEPTIDQTFINDPKFAWSHFKIQHSREDKLDEL